MTKYTDVEHGCDVPEEDEGYDTWTAELDDAHDALVDLYVIRATRDQVRKIIRDNWS